MKSIHNKIIILLIIFFSALTAYYFLSQNTQNPEEIIYTSVEEANLPLVSIDMLGRNMNMLHGYSNDDKSDNTYDTLTVLGEDKKLHIHILESNMNILKIEYNLKNVDFSQILEQSTVEDISKVETGEDAIIQIGTELTKDTEYNLDITLTTEKQGSIHYFTKIKIMDEDEAKQVVDLADDFSQRNFDEVAAKENTKYVESDASGDNSTLGMVNLKSSFSQLTYNNMKLETIGQKDISLCEFDGNMGEVKLSFMAGRELEDGSHELYEITESFTTRIGAERLYIMDYQRTMNEVFLGDKTLISDNKVLLGIVNDDMISVLKSDNGRFITWVSSRDLWCLDTKNNTLIKVYSFRSGSDSGLRSNYDKHNIKILSCDDEGNINFLLYGYMNRGTHEGKVGISLLGYDTQNNVIKENTYIKSNENYEELEKDMDKLSYLGDNGILYLKLGSSFYGVDIKSNEYMVICDNLRDGNYAVSELKSRIAWQETDDKYGSESVHFMNLDTGTNKEVKEYDSKLVKPIGFIDMDLIVGIADKKDIRNINGKDYDLPFMAIEILDDDMKSQKYYEKQDRYLSDITVTDGRVHLSLLQKYGDEGYQTVGEDTIVCTVKLATEIGKEYSTMTMGEKKKVSYISLDKQLNNQMLKTITPKSISYEGKGDLSLNDSKKTDTIRYSAYGQSSLIGTYDSFGIAIENAYKNMGKVKVAGQLVYTRAGTYSTHTSKDIPQGILELAKADKLTSLRGAELKAVLYYVGKSYPILAYNKDSDPVLIIAYDRTNISLYDINTESIYKMGIQDASEMFESGYNDFYTTFTF